MKTVTEHKNMYIGSNVLCMRNVDESLGAMMRIMVRGG